MLRIASGHSVDYYLEQVATGRESYYTGAVAEGEPPGRWSGRGAAALGLSGLVDAQDATALYAHFVDPRDENFRNPERWADTATLGHKGRRYQTAEELYATALTKEPNADAERRDELRLDAAKRARHNVAFLDATFSVQKSISILHTAFEAKEVAARKAGDLEVAQAWAEHRTAVEDAVWAGNNVMLDYLADKAGYSRISHHGGADGRWIDAHDWTVASFFQHDTRDHDPHLHIHNTVLNRAQCADGIWRTLDSRCMNTWRPAAAAVAERTTEEYLARSLSARLAMRPDGKAREVLGIASELIELASSRSRAITPKVAEMAAAYEAITGRAPKGKVLDRLNRAAADMTRKAKSHSGETREEFLRRVDREFLAETGAGLAKVAEDVVALAETPPEGQPWSPSAVLETALAELREKKAGWTEADLTRAINNALPDYLCGLDGTQVAALLNGLTAEGLTLVQSLKARKPGDDLLPASRRLANGESAYDEPGAELYASAEHIHTERLLRESASRRGAPAMRTTAAEAFLSALDEEGIELGEDQAAAVRGVLSSGACVESLVGPAGTGKSFVVGALAEAWQEPTLWGGQQHRVVALATTEIATQVLAGEGVPARNISRWLAIQDRLATGHPLDDDRKWQLTAGDLVVVDESAMVDTAALAAVHQRVTDAGAKLLLTGDHRQLAAVGAGGAMDLIVQAGAAYELAEARRFTNPWEQQASLRLRAGDQSVLTEYHKHGRLVDAGTVEQAEDSAAQAWLGDTLAGKHSLLVVNSNEQAARVCANLRVEFIRLGLVEEAGVPLGLQGTYAGVGDLVQARRIARGLAGYEGNHRGPINREQYRVLETRPDGGLVVAPVLGRGAAEEQLGDKMTLPGSYVREHLALGYAATEYATQGVSVDTTHTVTTTQTSQSGFYVAMTRGREANTAHVATRTVADDDASTGAIHDAVHRSPATVLALAFERHQPCRSALAIQAESAAEAASIRTIGERLSGFAAEATAGRAARWLDQLVDTRHLTTRQRARIAAEDGAVTLSRILRRAELAGHDPHQVLREAISERSLDGARQLTNVIYDRIVTNQAVSLDPVGNSYTDWTPQVDNPEDQRFLTTLAHAADARRQELGQQTAEQPPGWALEAFGPVPTDPTERRTWQQRAGIVAAHRELSGHDDPTNPLGPLPKPGQVEAYASWRAAWRALGRPDADTEEMHLSDGQLRMRIRAYEREKAWAPPNVTHQLAATRQAATRHRNTATRKTAEAHAATDDSTRTRILQEAAEAAALAELLDAQAADLAEIDDTRSYWLVDTAVTRVNAERATAELAARHATNPPPDDTTNAEDWLAHQAACQREEDTYRQITDEHDLADLADQRAADKQTVDDPAANHALGAEAAVPDIRETAASEPPRPIDDSVRVPTAQETADDLTRARRALTEITQRRVIEQHHSAEQARAQQMARWHNDDLAVDQAAIYDHGLTTSDTTSSPAITRVRGVHDDELALER